MNKQLQAPDVETQDAVKHIQAITVREGLNEVRKLLGADAIILAQEYFPQGVHIWATDDVAVASTWRKPSEQPTDGNAQAAATAATTEEQSATESFEQVNQSEIALNLPPLAEPNHAMSSLQTEWHDHAAELGYQAHHLEGYQVARCVGDLREAMCQDLIVHEVPGTLTGRMLFFGSPGVGKTTFLLKQLVASLNYQASSDIAVVNCDQHKLGGGETIALACQIFGVECFDVQPQDLEAYLPVLAQKQLVLIDTPGMSSQWTTTMPMSRTWVVSATQHPRQLQKYWAELQTGKPNYIALTHCDDVPDGDDLLRRLHQWRLPVLGVNSAAEFAVDLTTLDQQTVFDLLFTESAQKTQGVRIAV